MSLNVAGLVAKTMSLRIPSADVPRRQHNPQGQSGLLRGDLPGKVEEMKTASVDSGYLVAC